MTTAGRGLAFCAVFVAAYTAVLAPAEARWELWETEETYAELGANLQLMSAYVYLGDLGEATGVGDDAGLGGAVGRLEWSFDLGSRADVDVHNRLLWQSSTLPTEFLFQGFEVSAGDDRRLDTQLDLIDGETTQLTHDLDRAVVGLYFDALDFYLGRQAIRWGVSELFPVADRFAPLSPFELDTLQRRGIDAGWVVTHLSPSLEFDVVVADRGENEPLSIAGRGEYFGGRFDAYGGFGRFWERLSAMGGLSVLAGNWKVFGEGEALWNLDDEEFDLPRATVGAQRVSMEWQIGAEYHFNGFGAGADEDYLTALMQPEFARGETYFFGRHYAGATGFYFFDAGWIVGGGAIANVVDPSVVVFPTVEYEIEQQFSVRAGAYVGFGEGAGVSGEQASAPFTIPSEFGGVSDLYFVQMTAFF